jgi:hypothetical protein
MGTRCHAASVECATSPAEIGLIVKEYLIQQMWIRRSFNWCPNVSIEPETRPTLPVNRRKVVVETLCHLSRELLFDYEPAILDMTQSFNSYFDGDIGAPIDYESFEAIAAEVFCEEIKWSHILIILLFGCELALVHGVSHGQFEIVNDMHGHLTTYLTRHLANWISDHQGWEGLVAWSEERVEERRLLRRDTTDDHENCNSSSSWFGSKMFRIGATVGALCVAAALIGMFGASKH